MKRAYRHTQVGTVILAGMLAGMVLVAAISILKGWDPVGVFALAALAVFAFLFHSLTVEISDGTLSCRFGPGLVKRQFYLSEIHAARTVRNRWYYGWGIRYIPGGWLFNVSGLDAVEIVLSSGRKFRIGTDEPDELAGAILENLDETGGAAAEN